MCELGFLSVCVSAGDYDKQRPDPGEQQIKIQKVIIHPHFHAFTFDSDLALLYLARPVQKGPTAVPACLPDAHLSKYLLKVISSEMMSAAADLAHLSDADCVRVPRRTTTAW